MHPRMLKSTARVGHSARLFQYSDDDDDEKRMQVQFARVCVLYDDLMLEYAGAAEDAIPILNGSGLNARRFYFVRRQLGTLSELRGAIVVLNANKTSRGRRTPGRRNINGVGTRSWLSSPRSTSS